MIGDHLKITCPHCELATQFYLEYRRIWFKRVRVYVCSECKTRYTSEELKDSLKK